MVVSPSGKEKTRGSREWEYNWEEEEEAGREVWGKEGEPAGRDLGKENGSVPRGWSVVLECEAGKEGKREERRLLPFSNIDGDEDRDDGGV